MNHQRARQVYLAREMEREVHYVGSSTCVTLSENKQRYTDGLGVFWSRRTVQADEKLTIVCYGAKVVSE